MKAMLGAWCTSDAKAIHSQGLRKATPTETPSRLQKFEVRVAAGHPWLNVDHERMEYGARSVALGCALSNGLRRTSARRAFRNVGKGSRDAVRNLAEMPMSVQAKVQI